jgi:glycine betaine transporter
MQLYFSAGLILAIVLWGIVSPNSLGAVFDLLLAVITRDFGWLYLWVVLGLVVLAMVLAFSRYGDLKLGAEDDEPEFSIGSWFAMLFAAGMGIGLVFWGVAEPISHYGAPPPGIVANTPEAANAAMRYSFFHWGCTPGRSIASWRWPLHFSSSARAVLRW